MKIYVLTILLVLFSLNKINSQVGTMTGWGMAICNTYSFNICPNQTITPFNYGLQGWVCNSMTMPDISFNIMGPVWRVARHNYSFTATSNGQIQGYDPIGTLQTIPFNATQIITPSSSVSISSANYVIFAINGVPVTYTLNENTFSISINPVVFGATSYTLCSNTTSSISISPTVPAVGGPWVYTWQPGNLTGNPVTVSPSSSTIYTLSASSGVCTNTTTVAVTVTNCCTQSLSLAINGPSNPVCPGSTTTLSASGAGSGGTYTWNPGNITGSSISVSPISTTIYTVTGASSSNCRGTNTIQVNVNASPIAIINSNSPICAGQSINLSGSGGFSYQWSGPNNFQSFLQNPNISPAISNNSGIYTLTVTDANNCIGTTTQNIVVNSLPIISAYGNTVCLHQNINLTANGGTNYTWSGPGNFISFSQNPVISNASPTNAGQYTVVVMDINSCIDSAIVNVAIDSISTVVAGCNNSSVCLNDLLVLTASGGNSYAWSGPNGFFSTAQNPSLTVTSFSGTANYSVTISDNFGCSTQTVISVFINPLPTLLISSNVNSGCAPLCPLFTCSGSSPVNSCIFNFGGNSAVNNDTASTCFTSSGIFTITASVSDTNNCVNSATYTVNVYPMPVADFNYSPIKPVINIDQQVVFTDASWGTTIASWNWYFMNTAQYTSIEQNPTFTYPEAGTYPIVLVVKNDRGCSDTIIKSITVSEDFGIYIPDAFTPNGDGLNDIFQPKGFGIVKYEMEIFDRWGEQLFTTKDFNEGWKGTNSRGQILKEDIYAWKIILTNVYSKSEEYTGHVSLMK